MNSSRSSLTGPSTQIRESHPVFGCLSAFQVPHRLRVWWGVTKSMQLQKCVFSCWEVNTDESTLCSEQQPYIWEVPSLKTSALEESEWSTAVTLATSDHVAISWRCVSVCLCGGIILHWCIFRLVFFSPVELNWNAVVWCAGLESDREGRKRLCVCIEWGGVVWNIPEHFGHMLTSRHHASLTWVDAEQAII